MHNLVHIPSLSAILLKCGCWLAFPTRAPTEVVIQSPGRSFVMHFFYRCQSVFNLAALVFNLAVPEQSGGIANTAGGRYGCTMQLAINQPAVTLASLPTQRGRGI